MTNTENQTRKEIIDKQLLAAGWDITDYTQIIEEFDIKIEPSESVHEDIAQYNTPQFSDYALIGKDGKPLAVIEAKKTSKNASKDINAIGSDAFWEKLSHDKIEFLRNNIKPLFRTISQTDFKDSVFLKEMVEFGPEQESINEPQINQLADVLHQGHPHITIDLLKKTYNNPKAKFIQFIRHILGLKILLLTEDIAA